jgi:predicted helicase
MNLRPNIADSLITSSDERYIVNLVERVTRVSVETVALVNGLPSIS